MNETIDKIMECKDELTREVERLAEHLEDIVEQYSIPKTDINLELRPSLSGLELKLTSDKLLCVPSDLLVELSKEGYYEMTVLSDDYRNKQILITFRKRRESK